MAQDTLTEYRQQLSQLKVSSTPGDARIEQNRHQIIKRKPQKSTAISESNFKSWQDDSDDEEVLKDASSIAKSKVSAYCHRWLSYRKLHVFMYIRTITLHWIFNGDLYVGLTSYFFFFFYTYWFTKRLLTNE